MLLGILLVGKQHGLLALLRSSLRLRLPRCRRRKGRRSRQRLGSRSYLRSIRLVGRAAAFTRPQLCRVHWHRDTVKLVCAVFRSDDGERTSKAAYGSKCDISGGPGRSSYDRREWYVFDELRISGYTTPGVGHPQRGQLDGVRCRLGGINCVLVRQDGYARRRSSRLQTMHQRL